MTTYFMIAQQVMSAFSLNANEHNATEASGQGPSNSTSPPSITDFSSLVAFLFSFRALTDWLMLIVMGGAVESLRRLLFQLYFKIIASFWITASFNQDDSSYDWMMVWLSKKSSWNTVRQVDISTRSFGLNSNAVIVPGEEEDLSMLAGRKIAYLPSPTLTFSLWYHRHYITINRIQTQTGWRGSQEETLQIRILARTHSVLNELLLEAKREYLAAQDQSVNIYVSDSNNSWRHVASRPKRSLSSIILDPGVSELLVDDARDFLESKSWYAARGIPFRRGYLLYGAPGSGKTSIISSIAGELSLDVYIVSLSRSGLDDAALSELISDLPEKCICLMEDIDCAFSQSLNREEPPPPPPPNVSARPDDGPPPPPTASKPTSRLSLSGLLNALDGVAAQEGRILYATTNKYTALDPALCRPGRMDIHVEFKLASKYQARRLFTQFYLPIDDVKTKKSLETKGVSKEIDSGYTSAEDADDIDLNLTTSRRFVDGPTYFGTTHGQHAPKLRPKQIAALAERFAEAIPEREVSMASLQGYLMTYKIRPFEAVRAAHDWVKSERESRAKRERA
ncbi:Mitochondrial chaperone BCS1 [Mycena indigotica]|uniref:Mitochondrial chaperone BCS1 n=1 Tax=Mycena indigotica TaxID=2126181 RepID=A0A8H6T2L9_9AGAR|nr:Mitochondrial chaperone BCS1 [Mycena indigotica]KAF7309891.1 Mitochondrial chaperone BCS1 [Mycena indigotica]